MINVELGGKYYQGYTLYNPNYVVVGKIRNWYSNVALERVCFSLQNSYPAAKFKPVLYSDINGEPGALLAEGPVTTGLALGVNKPAYNAPVNLERFKDYWVGIAWTGNIIDIGVIPNSAQKFGRWTAATNANWATGAAPLPNPFGPVAGNTFGWAVTFWGEGSADSYILGSFDDRNPALSGIYFAGAGKGYNVHVLTGSFKFNELWVHSKTAVPTAKSRPVIWKADPITYAPGEVLIVGDEKIGFIEGWNLFDIGDIVLPAGTYAMGFHTDSSIQALSQNSPAVGAVAYGYSQDDDYSDGTSNPFGAYLPASFPGPTFLYSGGGPGYGSVITDSDNTVVIPDGGGDVTTPGGDGIQFAEGTTFPIWVTPVYQANNIYESNHGNDEIGDRILVRNSKERWIFGRRVKKFRIETPGTYVIDPVFGTPMT